MAPLTPSGLDRREFLKTGAAAGVGLLGAPMAAWSAGAAVSIVLDPADPIASAAPVRWAAGELEKALAGKGVSVRVRPRQDRVPAGEPCVVVCGAGAPSVAPSLAAAGASVPTGAEALVLASATLSGRPVTLACGSDVRGAVYAVLELADRVAHARDPVAALATGRAVVERPANVVRSVTRYFQSDVEDKPWYQDRAMWGPYLSMLAAHRFNRFSLAFGLGYNFPRDVSDVYLYFAYPFLLSVPGYAVRAVPLPDAEREANLETLRFIGEECARRGLQFQLGLWTHAYQWIDSPRANYTIEGLTAQNHAAYCRDALKAVLEACPTITGLTFRIHGESGVPEGSYDFWTTLFDGIVRSGRKVEIDMHAKGIDQRTIDIALATGMPVAVSPKYWGEHMGLPYHQAAIRELERDTRPQTEGPFTLSGGSRRFTRYGYADLLREDRRYGILHRIWPGTQRVLLWGDPAMAAGYGRLASFCGSLGVELSEPLSFKGRIGSGLAGGRCAYADASLDPKYDWQKYLYQYRVWGRLTYDPEADPDTWRRALRAEFQDGAADAEAALASASRVLPLVTTAHGLSGSNNTYWPEMYTNMPIVDEAKNRLYRDTPAPRRFGTVTAFDPELFSRVDDCADALLGGTRGGKYSPVEVAVWLDALAKTAAEHVPGAVGRARGAAARRFETDVLIQSGLGRFFAAKLRAGVLWALYEKTGDQRAGQAALEAYRAARRAWAELAERGKGVYKTDVTFGQAAHLRGHWLDRLPAIDEDIADMEKRLGEAASPAPADPERVARAIREVLAPSARPVVACRHAAPARFRPGAPLELQLAVEGAMARTFTLRFRHVNQAEDWREEPMLRRDGGYAASIPADYTLAPYPLQYFFEGAEPSGARWLHPGFEPTLANLPYFVVRRG